MNPQDILKAQFLEVVENQLRENEPKETRKTLERLQAEGYSEIEAKHLIATCVIFEIFDVVQEEKPFNEARYTKNLQRLPKLPDEE